jgi:hypothetical protein
MSCAEHAADALNPGDGTGEAQLGHLSLAASALEGILLSAYEQHHDDAARVLADMLARLKEAAMLLGRR